MFQGEGTAVAGSEAGTNMKGRGTAWRPAEWNGERRDEVGDDVRDGYDGGL